jgi:protein Mpv17
MALYHRAGKSLLLSSGRASLLVRRGRFLSTEAATTSSTTSSKRKGFVEWYEGHLSARPVLTKAITGACLWGLGDVVAQVVPAFIQDAADGDNDDNGTRKTKEFKYDFPRTARAVTFGFAIHAPLSHVHYNFLEWMTIRGGFKGLSIPVFKTVMEQFVYWSWFSNSLYHGAMGAMQGKNTDEIYNRIKDVLWGTQVAQWKFWIPVQLLNFQFVPVRHQLNVVLLTR